MRLNLSLGGVSAFELSRQMPRSPSPDLSRLSIPFSSALRHCCCTSTATDSTRLNATTNIEATSFWNFSFDGTKLTASVHSIWKEVAKLGDTVVDATCGNGLDTLRLAKLVCGEGERGVVYGFDLQRSALDNTACLLERELNPAQRERVKLLQMCHSKLGEVVGNNEVSVVAFNLGYLPGGDKHLITQAETTVKALKSATALLRSGGMITIIAYIGHPGGREEYEAVREFCTGLPTSSWICSHHECLNRPLCPHLFLLARR